ncbi:MAG: trypsin-like peptidase domain-containing protein [Patescibacteria group bacterium]
MQNILRNLKYGAIIVLVCAVLSGAGYYWYLQLVAINAVQRDLTGKISQLQNDVGSAQGDIASLTKALADAQGKPVEVVRQEIIKEKTQDEVLIAAVAKVAPAVVSLVVTKDVPQLEVVYVNPFGDDPFFKDFGFRIPQYRQKGTEEKKVGAGTGFIIRSDGYILTNRHVVEDGDAHSTVLLSNGTQESAEVLYRDSEHDVAILKINRKGLNAVSFGNSSSLQLGQSVFAIGNALGEYNNSVSVGVISGLKRTIQAASSRGSETLEGVIQTDAAINPGNSGGPLSNFDGKVVGVNVATVVGSENISFAIPADEVKAIIARVLR